MEMKELKFDEKKFFFDKEAAERPIKFIETFCTYLDGRNMGKPVKLLDFQKHIIRNAYGWKRKKDGLRKHRFIYVEIPKKNAKSPLLSDLGLFMLLADGELGAEIFACAGDKDQARIIFDAAKRIIEQNERLEKVCEVYKDAIFHKKTKSVFRVVSAEAYTKHGPRLQGLLFDELHVQPNAELWNTLTKGIASREQPQVWAITTAGVQGSFAERIHNYALDIKKGVKKDEYWLVYVFAAEIKDNPLSERTWRKANPGYGVTLQKEYFKQQKILIENDPTELNSFLRLHLNIWTGSSVAWEMVNLWENGNQGKIAWENVEKKQCFVGVDLAPKKDTSAACFIFPKTGNEFKYEDNEKLDMLWLYWIPEDSISERTKSESHQYERWVKEGIILTTPGNVTDFEFILKRFEEISKKVDILNLGLDRFAAWDFMVKLQYLDIKAEFYGQFIKYISPPLKFFERKMIAKQINHGNNPYTRWQANNVLIKEDAYKNRMLDKQKSKKRIDGIAAAVNAFGMYLIAKEDAKTSKPYQDEGILFI